jgi:DNA-binding PucR family transcriptional regulator
VNLDVIKLHAENLGRAAQDILAHITNTPDKANADVIRGHLIAAGTAINEIIKQVPQEIAAAAQRVQTASVAAVPTTDAKQLIEQVRSTAIGAGNAAVQQAIAGIHSKVVDAVHEAVQTHAGAALQAAIPTKSHNPWPWIAGLATAATMALGATVIHLLTR